MRLIASENYASRAVMEATRLVPHEQVLRGLRAQALLRGASGHRPGRGAGDRARRRSSCHGRPAPTLHVNVQPYSGSPANLAVYLAFCNAGRHDHGPRRSPAGGHLTHGHTVSITGQVLQERPVRRPRGATSASTSTKCARSRRSTSRSSSGAGRRRTRARSISKAFRAIADEVGAILAADIAHISGLVARACTRRRSGIADVVTSTTHKTFRGPRGGMIFCKKEHAAAIDKAVFPGLQGGPHNHMTAAIAVAAREARAARVQDVRAAASSRTRRRSRERWTSAASTSSPAAPTTTSCSSTSRARASPARSAAQALDRAGIVLNYNAVPFDPRKPFDPSGVRIGTPAVTSRGMGKDVMVKLAEWIDARRRSARATRRCSRRSRAR